MPDNIARRAHLIALNGMIDRAMAFADAGDHVLIGAKLAECQDCARLSLAEMTSEMP